MSGELPPVGTELTIAQMVDLTASDCESWQREANMEFFMLTHRLLSDSGLWGWPATETVWKKVKNGFRRVS